MPLQPPWTRSGPDRRCAGIRTSRVYPQVISSGIYSEKTQNLGSDILNLGSRKSWKFSKTRFFIYPLVLSIGGGGEGFYIRLWCGGRGMRSDCHSYLSNDYNALWRRFVHGNRGGPTLVTNWHRSPAVSPASPSPTPQNPRHWLTDGRSELIYKLSENKQWDFVSSFSPSPRPENKQWDLVSSFSPPPRPAPGFRNFVFVNWGVVESTSQINRSEWHVTDRQEN
jgi:hypothetical protein